MSFETDNYTPIPPFRFWCQKVLPLVYDDSLSYYELLCKVVNYVNTESDAINNLNEVVEQLTNYLNSYFIAPTEFRYNIAYAVGGTLNTDNFLTAFNTAINGYKYIYIPAGNYNFDVIGKITVSQDIDILLDKNAVLYRETGTDGLFEFVNCKVTWNGGTLRSGTSAISHNMIYKSTEQGGKGLLEAAITLDGCKDSHITNLRSEYSQLPGVIILVNTTRVLIDYCYIARSVESAIRIYEHCVETVVDNCEINEVYIPANHSDIYYAYAIATGLKHLDDVNITPPDVLVYSNNVIIGCEDSALDTHGATNVKIVNNTVKNCSTAITAYNDNRRTIRPAGWTMNNILIENNNCISNVSNESVTGHPYILLGASNSHKSTDSGYENNPGSYDAFNNLVFRNNYISTPNAYSLGILDLNVCSRNVLIENNVFDGRNSAVRPFVLTNCIDFVIKNNVIKNMSGAVLFNHAFGVLGQNTNFLCYNNSSINYVKGLDDNDILTGSPWALRGGDIFTNSGHPHIATNYGLRARLASLPEAVEQTFSLTVSNGVATIENNTMLPGLALVLDSTTNAYVKHLIDFEHFTIVNTSGQAITDGTYTAALRDITSAALDS